MANGGEKRAYESYIDNLRSYDVLPGAMPRTWKGSRPAPYVRPLERKPVKLYPETLMIEGHAIKQTPTDNLHHSNSQPQFILDKTGQPRPASARQALLLNQSNALSQPKWQEIPFHNFVTKNKRQDIIMRKHLYQNRLFNYNLNPYHV